MYHGAGIIVGLYFVGIFLYLFTNAWLPPTLRGGWRGPADVIAVSFYLLGVVPLFGIALLELGVLKRGDSAQNQLKLHATFTELSKINVHRRCSCVL